MFLISILTTVDNTVKECKLMNMHCKKKKKNKATGCAQYNQPTAGLQLQK